MVVALTARQWALKGCDRNFGDACSSVERATADDLDTESGRFQRAT